MPDPMTPEWLAEIAARCADMQRWHDEDLASEQTCVGCESSVHCPADLDPTPLCDPCAQEMACDDVPALLSEVRRLTAENSQLFDERGAALSAAGHIDNFRRENQTLRAELERAKPVLDAAEALRLASSKADSISLAGYRSPSKENDDAQHAADIEEARAHRRVIEAIDVYRKAKQ